MCNTSGFVSKCVEIGEWQRISMTDDNSRIAALYHGLRESLRRGSIYSI